MNRAASAIERLGRRRRSSITIIRFTTSTVAAESPESPTSLGAIVRDRLHVLVYLDIGIHAILTHLAALRLAPVHYVGWGTPVTSGLPTMDDFLSSELMEPDDGQTHYSEKLVRSHAILVQLGVTDTITGN